MKITLITVFATLGCAAAFAPVANVQKPIVALQAEADQSRKAFLSAAGAAMFGSLIAPGIAGAMDQDNVNTPSEQWETGSPTPGVEQERFARYTNARTQLNSNFPPIKRLTVERKSPVTRLDINYPDFGAYQKSYPGLFREPVWTPSAPAPAPEAPASAK